MENKAEVPATAMFDTGCHGPNWVSKEIIRDLGMESKIEVFEGWRAPKLKDANGKPFEAIGQVALHWQFHGHTYAKWFSGTFCVTESNHIQVIFGLYYIVEKRLVSVNNDMMIPLISDKKIKLCMSGFILHCINTILSERLRSRTNVGRFAQLKRNEWQSSKRSSNRKEQLRERKE